jgi:hypothetical protein
VTWFDHHHRGRKLAAAARLSQGRGEEAAAQRLYAQAAEEAEKAMALVPREKHVTLGAVAMSAARWWRRAHRSEDAARVARLIEGAPDLFPVTLSPLDGTTPTARPPKRP